MVLSERFCWRLCFFSELYSAERMIGGLSENTFVLTITTVIVLAVALFLTWVMCSKYDRPVDDFRYFVLHRLNFYTDVFL